MKTIMFEGHLVDMIDQGVFEPKVLVKQVTAPYNPKDDEDGDSAKYIENITFTVAKKARISVRRMGTSLELLGGDQLCIMKSQSGHNIGVKFERVGFPDASEERVVRSDFESISELKHPKIK